MSGVAGGPAADEGAQRGDEKDTARDRGRRAVPEPDHGRRRWGPAVEVEGPAKRYPRAAVDSLAGVSFRVGRGEASASSAPNGAGKSTTIGT